MDIVGEAQGGSERTVNRAARLVGKPGQVAVPALFEGRCKRPRLLEAGDTVIFGIRIINLIAGFYLRMTQEKALAKAEKEKKDLYLQACLERIRTFTPIVYSADRITREEALAAQKRLVALLSYKLKQEYLEMCGFVNARMSLKNSEV